MSKKKVEKELEVEEKGKEVTEIFRSMVREHPIEAKYLKEKVFTNIKKLKCDYTTYKEEREKHNMPVETNCSKCGKSFETREEIYTAFEEDKQGSCIICGNCARGWNSERNSNV
ncbi:MAG: hypothetical protein HFJ52_03110 [Clostridia bacterium]|nr:hypothetical protein [Clostridia bacterium]